MHVLVLGTFLHLRRCHMRHSRHSFHFHSASVLTHTHYQTITFLSDLLGANDIDDTNTTTRSTTKHGMANPDDNGCTLRQGLDKLPPELEEMIYDFTFTADAKIRMYSREPGRRGIALTRARLHELAQGYSKEIVTVNDMPCLLHVDRASRKKFAESFYGNPNSLFIFSHYRLPVAKAHLKLVNDLRIGVQIFVGVPSRRERRSFARYTQRNAESIPFIGCKEIETLLRERAGAIHEQCC